MNFDTPISTAIMHQRKKTRYKNSVFHRVRLLSFGQAISLPFINRREYSQVFSIIFTYFVLSGECFAILVCAKSSEGLRAVVMFTSILLTTILCLLPHTTALPSTPSLPKTPQHNLSKRLIPVSSGLVRTPVVR